MYRLRLRKLQDIKELLHKFACEDWGANYNIELRMGFDFIRQIGPELIECFGLSKPEDQDILTFLLENWGKIHLTVPTYPDNLLGQKMKVVLTADLLARVPMAPNYLSV